MAESAPGVLAATGAGTLRATAGTLSEGNSRVGVESRRRGLIVRPPAARVAATGTMYEIARESAPMKTRVRATLLRRSARRLKRSAAMEPSCQRYEVMPLLPSIRRPPSRPHR